MNRPCFALSLLLATLATMTVAVSQARCQSRADVSDESPYGCLLYEDGFAESAEERQDDCRHQDAKSAADETPRQAADAYDGYEEDFGYDADDYDNDGYGYDEYGYDEYGYDEYGYDAYGKDADDADEYKAYEADQLDPEYVYADDYAPYEYDDGADDADEPAEATDEQVDPGYDFHAGHDPVYDEAMFGDDEAAIAKDTGEAVESDPQPWDDYDYDSGYDYGLEDDYGAEPNYESGYDYENPYEQWYADDIHEQAPSSRETDKPEWYDFEDNNASSIGDRDSAFEEAYDEYWKPAAPAMSSDGRAARSDWEDCYGDCWFDFGHAERVQSTTDAVEELVVRGGEECAAIGTEARSAVLLLMASALDRVGGALQNASDDLTRLARGETTGQSR
jgi:hypothetical protein